MSESATLDSIESYLGPSSGVNLGWYVFESSNNSTYSLVHSQVKPAPSSSTTWQQSDPVNVLLEEGKYYVIVCHWAGTSSYFWASATSQLTAFEQGQMIGGVTGSNTPTILFYLFQWLPHAFEFRWR